MAGKSGGEDESGDIHIVFSPKVFGLVFGSALTGGAGLYGLLTPGLQAEAVQACYDNSQIAIDIAKQHGEEHVIIYREIENKTRDRYTQSEADDRWRRHDQDELTQNRRITLLESQLEILSNRAGLRLQGNRVEDE